MLKVASVYLGRKGGGPVYSLEVAKELAKRADVLNVISKQTDNLIYWKQADLKLYTVNTYSSALGFIFSSLNIFKFYKLYKTIKKFSPEVIYYPFFHLWLPLINLLFPKIPKVYTCHDPILHSGEDWFWYRWLQDAATKQSKRVIVLSSTFVQTIKSKGVEEIDVIPHGIFDYYQKEAEKNSLRITSHPPTILFFGRILKYKGLDLILQALPIIKEKIPQVKLLIVGTGDISSYQDLINKNKYNIEITNRWIEDNEVGQYFLQADILVCPYKQASQSGAIPLAYAFKKPVVATKVGGLVEQVDDLQTGILVPADNLERLAKICVKILRDNNLRCNLGEGGYNKAWTEWNWSVVSDKILTSLQKAVN